MSFLKLSTLFVMLASVYVSNQQVISNICTLPVDSGSCDGRILNYYYDSAAGECEYFYYGGCGGNSNRFLTKTECMLKCTLLTRGKITHLFLTLSLIFLNDVYMMYQVKYALCLL